MRIKEELADEIKRIEKGRGRSVSSLVSEADKKLLDLAGKTYVAPDALEELEKSRRDEDRF